MQRPRRLTARPDRRTVPPFARPFRALLGPATALTRGLLRRFHLERILERFPERPVRAAFMFIAGFVAIAALATVAMVFHTPAIFPSLGATAFLLFFSPTVAAACPRSVVLGHLLGIASGVAALSLVGLYGAPPVDVDHIATTRVVAVAISLAAAGAGMVLCDAPHPPAGATAMIVSLGLITRPHHLLVMVLAVLLLTALGIAINRLAGLDTPLWRARPPHARRTTVRPSRPPRARTTGAPPAA